MKIDVDELWIEIFTGVGGITAELYFLMGISDKPTKLNKHVLFRIKYLGLEEAYNLKMVCEDVRKCILFRKNEKIGKICDFLIKNVKDKIIVKEYLSQGTIKMYGGIDFYYNQSTSTTGSVQLPTKLVAGGASGTSCDINTGMK